MKERYVGYVINSNVYKDNDSLLTILCENGTISLRARGVRKINSKNASSVLNYAYSEFEVDRSPKSNYLTLSEGRLLDYPSFIDNNLEYISLINFISEGIELIDNKEENFTNYVSMINCMKKKIDSKLILIAFLNYFMINQGCYLNFDSCVKCGSKEAIVKVSFDKGGYLCKHCYSGISDDLEYLKNIRVMSKISYENIEKIKIEDSYLLNYIKDVICLIKSNIGVYFKSEKFLLRIMEGK